MEGARATWPRWLRLRRRARGSAGRGPQHRRHVLSSQRSFVIKAIMAAPPRRLGLCPGLRRYASPAATSHAFIDNHEDQTVLTAWSSATTSSSPQDIYQTLAFAAAAFSVFYSCNGRPKTDNVKSELEWNIMQTCNARPGGMAALDGRENVRNTWEARLERWCAAPPEAAPPARSGGERTAIKRERPARRASRALPHRATRLRSLRHMLPRRACISAPRAP